jgi:hypothetical protein
VPCEMTLFVVLVRSLAGLPLKCSVCPSVSSKRSSWCSILVYSSVLVGIRRLYRTFTTGLCQNMERHSPNVVFTVPEVVDSS